MRDIHNEADFADFLVASDVGILYVSSTWWPPRERCEALLRDMVAYLEPDVSVASVNADDCAELCDKLNVRSVPAILVFQQTLEVRRFRGAHMLAEIIRLAVATILFTGLAEASGRPRTSRRGRLTDGRNLFDDTASLFRDPPGKRLAGVFFCDSPQLGLDQARWLADQTSDVLLTQLTTLPPPIAHALAAHRGVLSFPKVRKLDAETAYILAQFRGQALVLDGLRTLSVVAAEQLSNFPGILAIAGLRRISPSVAGALSRHAGALILDGLVDMTADIATCLANHHGRFVSLQGIQSIYEENAKYLAQYPGTLCMTGLRSISNCAADELFATRGQLELYDHPELNSYARERLRRFM